VLHLAFCGGALVGCASCTKQPSSTEPGCGHWGLLAVHPDAQWTGTATSLITAAEHRLAALGCTEMQIEYDYDSGNMQSQHLRDWYEGSCGFCCIGGDHLRICRKHIILIHSSTSGRPRSSLARHRVSDVQEQTPRTLEPSTMAAVVQPVHQPPLEAVGGARARSAVVSRRRGTQHSTAPSRRNTVPHIGHLQLPRPVSQPSTQGSVTPPARVSVFRPAARDQVVSEEQAQPSSSQNISDAQHALFVQSLPVRIVTQQDVQDMADGWSLPECAICLDDYKAGDEQITLCCFHRFHTECAKHWLSRSCECPLCKTPQNLRMCAEFVG